MTPGSKKLTALVVSVGVVGALGIWRAHRPPHPSNAAPRAPPFAKVEGVTYTVSAQFGKPLKEANTDLKEKNYSDAIAKLKTAERTAGKTPADQYLIDRMLWFAYIKTNNLSEAAKYMEAQLSSGLTPSAEQPRLIKNLATINYQNKNYDKAIDFGNRAIKAGLDDEQTQTVVGQAYYLKGDWKGTREFEDELVTATIKQGKTPRKVTLQLLYSACFKLPDHECAVHTLEQLSRYYPGTEPMAPEAPVGTLLAYFFGPPLDVEGPKRLPTSVGR
jgi:tetratricopeptide (TPR) repeat protein